jgi:peptide/nickel transport system permease protein
MIAPLGRAPEKTAMTSTTGGSMASALTGSLYGRLGLLSLVAVVFAALAGPLLAPHDPTAVAIGPAQANPSPQFPLGTDQLGRDILSRWLNGGVTVLVVPLCANLLGFLGGGALGLIGAYRGGALDAIVTRLFDVIIAIPSLLLTLVLIAGLGSGWTTLIAVIAIVTTPRAGRAIRAAGQSVISHDYVTAAKLRGESLPTVLWHEVMPNVSRPVAAVFSLYLTYAITGVSTLSFLGLGAQPPSSDWGLMIAENRQFFYVNPWGTLVPAMSMGVLALAFTLCADALSASRHSPAQKGEAPS